MNSGSKGRKNYEDYVWYKDLPRVRAESKPLDSPIVPADAKQPIGKVLAAIKEATSYPEIMSAYASAPLDGQIPSDVSGLLTIFDDYIDYKYGMGPSVSTLIIVPLRMIANGQFTGWNDPNLRAYLKSNSRINSDDATSARL